MDENGTARVTVVQVTGDVLALTLGGVIDAATAPEATARLHDALAALPPPDLVVIDLTPVAFFAAAGAHLLSDLANACARRGLSVRLVAQPGSVAAHAVRVSGLDDELATFEDLAEALAGS